MTTTTTFTHDFLPFLVWFLSYNNVFHAKSEPAYLKERSENSSQRRQQQAGYDSSIKLQKKKKIRICLKRETNIHVIVIFFPFSQNVTQLSTSMVKK